MKQLLLTALAIASALTSARAQHGDEDLVKQLSNPVASLISVPFQNNFDFGAGASHDGWRYTMNFQPVIPVSLNDHWTLIIRTIVPYIHQEDIYKGAAPSFEQVLDGISIDLTKQQLSILHGAFNKAVSALVPGHIQDGLGDVTQSFFFSPKKPIGGTIIGAGPAFLYPTATNDLLGSEKWGAGPTFVALRQTGGWTYGVLANHIWSFAGNDQRRSVDSSFVQPFISYATKTKTTFTVNAEATYDWNESQWTVPLNLQVSQLVRIGKLPVSFTIGGRYYADGPSGAPEWGLRFAITPLFPTGGKPELPADGK
jgi:hypothetical protein